MIRTDYPHLFFKPAPFEDGQPPAYVCFVNNCAAGRVSVCHPENRYLYTQRASVSLSAEQHREIAAFVEQMERERERKHA
jgi:hypothetical protein